MAAATRSSLMNVEPYAEVFKAWRERKLGVKKPLK